MAWYNASWLKRIQITIVSNKLSGSPANLPICYPLSLAGTTFWNNIKSDGSDIVVTLGDETTKLNREIVGFDYNNRKGDLWFKPASITAGTRSFYIYFQNQNASETNSTTIWSDYNGVWHMNEIAADVIPDSTSNARHGIESGTTQVTGLSDALCANFDDPTTYRTNKITVADSGALINGWTGIGISLWCRAINDNNIPGYTWSEYRSLVGKASAIGAGYSNVNFKYAWLGLHRQSDALMFRGMTNVNKYFDAGVSNNANYGQWMHIIVYKQVNQGWFMAYQNNQNTAGLVYDAMIPPFSSTATIPDFQIGSSSYSGQTLIDGRGDLDWYGQIQEVRITNNPAFLIDSGYRTTYYNNLNDISAFWGGPIIDVVNNNLLSEPF